MSRRRDEGLEELQRKFSENDEAVHVPIQVLCCCLHLLDPSVCYSSIPRLTYQVLLLLLQM